MTERLNLPPLSEDQLDQHMHKLADRLWASGALALGEELSAAWTAHKAASVELDAMRNAVALGIETTDANERAAVLERTEHAIDRMDRAINAAMAWLAEDRYEG
jgi:hypothetical protein